MPYPDHGRTGLYGNGMASLGPADFGGLWSAAVEEMWESVDPADIQAPKYVANEQRDDSNRRLVEHLATTPDLMRLLRFAILMRGFTSEQLARVEKLLKKAEHARRQLLEENSRLAAYLRSKVSTATP